MFELQKRQRELNKTNKLYDNLIEKATKEKKSQDEIDSLVSEMFSETGIIEEEIRSLVSRKWVQTSEKLFCLCRIMMKKTIGKREFIFNVHT